VRIAVYIQAFAALLCYTFSSTQEFTHEFTLASSTTFIALAITSLVFIFGAPEGQPDIGLGRLRVVLALSTICYGPGFLNIYRICEHHRFAPLTYQAEEEKKEKDPALKANEHISSMLQIPAIVVVWAGLFAEIVLFCVCVAKLSGPTIAHAADFCGFSDIPLTAAESVGWCIIALGIPWGMWLFPYFMIAIFKSDTVYSWRLHVQKKTITAVVGKLAFWGYTAALCALTERFLREDPASYVPGNQEVVWTFGQILPLVLFFSLFVSVTVHVSKMPEYPIPDFQPSHSRFTLYFHLLTNCLSFGISTYCRPRQVGEFAEVHEIVACHISI
jgi:hypothetical protein